MSMFAPPPLLSVVNIKKRLALIFPDGTAQRSSLISEAAAKTVFVMLFIDAIKGRDVWLAPKHVYRMSEEVANDQSESNRRSYAKRCLSPKYQSEGVPWYADTTKELIRDDTIREALIPIGVAVLDASVPTTSSKGRYAITPEFAKLFTLSDTGLEAEIERWQDKYLAPAELAKVRIMQDRHNHSGSVWVRFPNNETRAMKVGKSSIITKAVIEEFAPRFLHNPYVLWVSESGEKVVHQDDKLMKQLGLTIDEKTLLPDLIMADLRERGVLILFIEIVATDGVITETRKATLTAMSIQAGYSENDIAFVTAFEQRDAQPLKKRLSGIARDSIIWCMAEPDTIIWIGEKRDMPLNIKQSNS